MLSKIFFWIFKKSQKKLYEYHNLDILHEKYYIELKAASELPNAFWESYSSFCNTSGDWIILGVHEAYPQNEIVGVGNPEKTLTSLWDQLSNSNKVSYKNVDNQDVNTSSDEQK